MNVYRITLDKWSHKLTASGYPARWNSKGKFVIYTAQNRALACLENMVHRSGEGLFKQFKVMVIQLPENIKCEIIDPKNLPEDWFEFKNYDICQQIGDEWLEKCENPILQVPSVIIANEYNYLINPNHPDFKTIELLRSESFEFDPRLWN